MTQVVATLPKRRRWMQFSLRTLLILPVLVGLACHWVAERSRREQALAEISKIGGVLYCDGYGKYGEVDLQLNFYGFDCGTGKTFFDPGIYSFEDRKFDEAGLYHLRYIPRLVSVDLSSMPVGDEAVKHLCALSNLKELILLLSDITDENVERLHQALPNCEIHADKHFIWMSPPKRTNREYDPMKPPSLEDQLRD